MDTIGVHSVGVHTDSNLPKAIGLISWHCVHHIYTKKMAYYLKHNRLRLAWPRGYFDNFACFAYTYVFMASDERTEQPEAVSEAKAVD